jgi:hypothetical protein
MCALDQHSLIGCKVGSIKLRKSSLSVSVITRMLPSVIGGPGSWRCFTIPRSALVRVRSGS